MNDDGTLKEILSNAKTVASVGISGNTQKVSNEVGAFLMEHGYQLIPVNPTVDEILGKKSYPDLTSVPEKIDVVQIFRRPEDVLPIVEEAIKVGAKTIWMQEGIVNEEAAEKAREAGLQVVMDACMRASYQRLISPSL